MPRARISPDSCCGRDRNILCGNWLAEQIDLTQRAAVSADEFDLRRCLEPFGNGDHAEGFAEVKHGFDDRAIFVAGFDAGDEGPIDLDHVDRSVPLRRDPRLPGPDRYRTLVTP